MLLKSLEFFDRTKLNLMSKIFPVKETETIFLDKIEIDLRITQINQIDIPSMNGPIVTTNFCSFNPELINLQTALPYVQIVTCPNCDQKLRLTIGECSIGKELNVRCPRCSHFFIDCISIDKLIEDLTEWLKEQIYYPKIKLLPVQLDIPKIPGKTYRQRDEKPKQLTLFDEIKEDKNCSLSIPADRH